MTLEELKAKHAAMTEGEWCWQARNWRGEAQPHKRFITGNRVEHDPEDEENSGYCTAVAVVEGNETSGTIADDNAIGIVAIHNHFPALMRRYEEMRRSCEWMLCALEHHGPYSYSDPALAAARAAIANANKPLETNHAD